MPKKGWKSKMQSKTDADSADISREELNDEIKKFKKKGGKIKKIKSLKLDEERAIAIQTLQK